jgi:hypothetical protein
MSESFTQAEYGILSLLTSVRQSTIPAIASDLLLRLGETQEALSSLISKGMVKQVGDAYALDALVEMAAPEAKPATASLAPLRLFVKPSAAPAPAPDVDRVFKQARERAQREKLGLR